jgi:hypothetical protein
MKTPREILLQRHESANARLDAIRRNVLAAQESSIENVGATQHHTPKGLRPLAQGCEVGQSGSDRATLGTDAEKSFSLSSWCPSGKTGRRGPGRGGFLWGRFMGRVSATPTDSNAQSTFKFQEILSFLAMKLWQELFWPCRRVWIGLGAAWLVILALNLAAGQAPKLAVNKSARPSRETLMAVREQRRLLIQLLDSGVSASTPPPASMKPRGELRRTVMLG